MGQMPNEGLSTVHPIKMGI